MISADTSVMVAYLQGEATNDVEFVRNALAGGRLFLSPVVIMELLSDPKLKSEIASDLITIPTMEITRGYWQRAGLSRANLISKNLKARVADTLVAQICIDHDTPLIARDKDFRHFKKHCGLKLIEF